VPFPFATAEELVADLKTEKAPAQIVPEKTLPAPASQAPQFTFGNNPANQSAFTRIMNGPQ